MELRCHQAVTGNDAAKAHAVIGLAGDDGLILGNGVVAVNEVEVRAVRNAFEHGMIRALSHLIPSHVRYLVNRPQPAYLPVHDAQTIMPAVLLRPVEQDLQADTYAQERPAGRYIAGQSIDNPELLKAFHRVSGGADARQYQHVSFSYLVRVIRHLGPITQSCYSVSNASYIARAVIYYRYHLVYPARRSDVKH
jgi:hypothetical protein